jgi:hypothetical protein
VTRPTQSPTAARPRRAPSERPDPRHTGPPRPCEPPGSKPRGSREARRDARGRLPHRVRLHGLEGPVRRRPPPGVRRAGTRGEVSRGAGEGDRSGRAQPLDSPHGSRFGGTSGAGRWRRRRLPQRAGQPGHARLGARRQLRRLLPGSGRSPDVSVPAQHHGCPARPPGHRPLRGLRDLVRQRRRGVALQRVTARCVSSHGGTARSGGRAAELPTPARRGRRQRRLRDHAVPTAPRAVGHDPRLPQRGPIGRKSRTPCCSRT